MDPFDLLGARCLRTDDDLLLIAGLASANAPRAVPFKVLQQVRFAELLDWDQEYWRANFGIDTCEFQLIFDALDFPPYMSTDVGDHIDSRIAFLMTLAYLRGRSYVGIESQFGWSSSRSCRFKTTVVAYLVRRWGHLLTIRRAHRHLLRPDRLRRYEAVLAKACGYHGIFGFVDGTLRSVARPNGRLFSQEDLYNGWKHEHAIKYQYISLPDGMYLMDGPYPGRCHDMRAWRESLASEWLGDYAMVNYEAPRLSDGQPLLAPPGLTDNVLRDEETGRRRLALYGDKAYWTRAGLIGAIKGDRTGKPPEVVKFHEDLKSYRVGVEQVIGTIPSLFPRFDLPRWQRVGQGPVADDYKAACLIRNCLTCVIGNVVSQDPRLWIESPSLEEYLSTWQQAGLEGAEPPNDDDLATP